MMIQGRGHHGWAFTVEGGSFPKRLFCEWWYHNWVREGPLYSHGYTKACERCGARKTYDLYDP